MPNFCRFVLAMSQAHRAEFLTLNQSLRPTNVRVQLLKVRIASGRPSRCRHLTNRMSVRADRIAHAVLIGGLDVQLQRPPEFHTTARAGGSSFSAGSWTLGEVWQSLRDRICIEVTGVRARARFCIGDHQIPANASTSYVTLAVISPTRSEWLSASS